MKDMSEMMKMLSMKDEGKEMSEQDIQAKMDVLKELLQFASKHAGDDIVGKLKQVTVAAPSEEGLEEGLDKAKEMVEEMPSEEDSMSEKSEDDMEEDEEEMY